MDGGDAEQEKAEHQIHNGNDQHGGVAPDRTRDRDPHERDIRQIEHGLPCALLIAADARHLDEHPCKKRQRREQHDTRDQRPDQQHIVPLPGCGHAGKHHAGKSDAEQDRRERAVALLRHNMQLGCAVPDGKHRQHHQHLRDYIPNVHVKFQTIREKSCSYILLFSRQGVKQIKSRKKRRFLCKLRVSAALRIGGPPQ